MTGEDEWLDKLNKDLIKISTYIGHQAGIEKGFDKPVKDTMELPSLIDEVLIDMRNISLKLEKLKKLEQDEFYQRLYDKDYDKSLYYTVPTLSPDHFGPPESKEGNK